MNPSKHKAYADYQDLRGDGRIVLYKRKDHDNPRWNVRIKVPGQTGYVVKSCKTHDFYEARRFSETLYYELEGRSIRGEAIKVVKFKRIYSEWLKEYPASMKGRSEQYIRGNIQRAAKHILPYFEKSSATEFSEDLIAGYFNHRRIQTPSLSNVTLRHEGTVLRHILTFAARKGYISSVCNIPQPKMKVSPRPDIPRKDWKKLYTYLRSYVKNAQDKRRFRERFYLQQWILIMGNTGIRVGEMRDVNWSDLSIVRNLEGETRVAFSVTGKTGHRIVIGNPRVEHYLQRLKEFRTQELGEEPSENEPLFCNRDGKTIGSFKKGFERVLSECGILYQKDGKRRVPYSLRHTYATMRISEGVDIYQLAANMGTSVDMIEMYYGKKRTTDPRNVTELTKMREKLPF